MIVSLQETRRCRLFPHKPHVGLRQRSLASLKNLVLTQQHGTCKVLVASEIEYHFGANCHGWLTGLRTFSVALRSVPFVDGPLSCTICREGSEMVRVQIRPFRAASFTLPLSQVVLWQLPRDLPKYRRIRIDQRVNLFLCCLTILTQRLSGRDSSIHKTISLKKAVFI